MEICRKLDCDTYINTIAGEELYSYDAFAKQNMKLNFIRMKPVEYSQYKDPFVQNLSFIDVMMFNDKEKIKDLLLQYDLI